MIILVPAYEPDCRLVDLVEVLQRDLPDARVLVVDDGSGGEYLPVFEAAYRAGAEVIGYPLNRGKGRALKCGIEFIILNYPGEDVVCADSDGQHRVTDIARVAERVEASARAGDAAGASSTMVLGGRRFTGDVPLRSRFGNALSRRAFAASTGFSIHDTQTGLRGYPASMLPWVASVAGERFEFELNLLLESRAAGIEIDEIEIETVYLEHNASSHFRPIVDSVRVMAPMIRYVGSSLAAFGVDAVALIALFALTNSLLFSVIGARVLSASVNFLVNRHVVFGTKEPGTLRRDALRYLALAVALLASSYVWLDVLTTWGVALVPAKILTDATLYVISYGVQRRYIFRGQGRAAKPVAPASPSRVNDERAPGAVAVEIALPLESRHGIRK